MAELKRYWDHRECRWVPYESPLAEIPEQAEPEDRQPSGEVPAGGETALRA